LTSPLGAPKMNAMGKGFRTIAVLLCVLCLAGIARAGLSAPSLAWLQAGADAVGDAGPAASPCNSDQWADVEGAFWPPADLDAGGLRKVVLPQPPSCPQTPVIAGRDPSAVPLLLSALGSLGAWQLVRGSRKAHLPHVPDWFHTGAPSRIGPTTVVDFSAGGLVPFVLDSPDAPPPARRLPPRPAPDVPTLGKRRFLTPAGTRGPPA